MSDKLERREIEFSNLDDISEDLHSLLSTGYRKHGDWNLSQICGHLNEWMRFPMDGFPKPPFPIRLLLSLLRVTRGKKMLAGILHSKAMPVGGPTMPQTVFEWDAESDVNAVQKLTETIEKLKKHTGLIHPSPLFGKMDKQTLERLQMVHCAHHLSFLIPTN